MSYMVDGGTGNRPVFETLDEASRCANEVLRRTRVVLAVTETNKEATHTWCETDSGCVSMPILYEVQGWSDKNKMADFESKPYKRLSSAKRVFNKLKADGYQAVTIRKEKVWTRKESSEMSTSEPIESWEVSNG